MPFKVGSFNLLPSFLVMSTCVAGIGALPWAVKYALNWEKPARKDQFERYLAWKKDVFDVERRPAEQKQSVEADQRASMESAWRAAHAAGGAKLA